jgi:hypothetical protein
MTDRFWPKVRKTDTCWLWTAAKTNHGYGNFWTSAAYVGAHRVAYELEVGPIPAGLDLDHLCRNRACVNPAHLEPVTRQENLLRGATLPASEVLRTHCPHGHPYSETNTLRRRGSRECRTCIRGRNRRAYVARVARAAA